MGLRENLEKNPAAGYAVAGVVGLLAVFLLLRVLNRGGGPIAEQKWAFDLNTGQLIAASSASVAPFETDSGTFSYPNGAAAGAGVDIDIYGCGGCDGLESGMTIAEIETAGFAVPQVSRMEQSAYEATVGAGINPYQAITDAKQVGEPDGKAWYSPGAPQARALRQKVADPCPGGGYMRRCGTP